MAHEDRFSRGAVSSSASARVGDAEEEEDNRVYLAHAAKASAADNVLANTRALRLLCKRNNINLLGGTEELPEELRHLSFLTILSSCAPLLDTCAHVIQHDQIWPVGPDATVSCPYVMAGDKETGSRPCVVQMTLRAENFLLRLVYDAWRAVLPGEYVLRPADTVWWDVLAQYVRTGVCVSEGWGVKPISFWEDIGVSSLRAEADGDADDDWWEATTLAAYTLAKNISVAYLADDRRVHPSYANLQCLGSLPSICQIAQQTRGLLVHISDIVTNDQARERSEGDAVEIWGAIVMANGRRLQLSVGAMGETVRRTRAAWVAAVPDSSASLQDEDWVWEEIVRAYVKTGVRITEGWGVGAPEKK